VTNGRRSRGSTLHPPPGVLPAPIPDIPDLPHGKPLLGIDSGNNFTSSRASKSARSAGSFPKPIAWIYFPIEPLASHRWGLFHCCNNEKAAGIFRTFTTKGKSRALEGEPPAFQNPHAPATGRRLFKISRQDYTYST
jgi:hypothetical protein